MQIAILEYFSDDLTSKVRLDSDINNVEPGKTFDGRWGSFLAGNCRRIHPAPVSACLVCGQKLPPAVGE